MRKRKFRNQERGMALLIALLALLLVSAIGMGMMYMSSTETSINANYRDTQQAFFAMRAGLEEMRDRMRVNNATYASNPLPLPTLMPSNSNAGSIVYITNPSAGETVDPVTYSSTNNYFDDEFCHETFSGFSPSGTVTTGVPCSGTGQAPPSGAKTIVASISPFTGTSSALKYKWVRITLKQNGTIPGAPVVPFDATHPANSQICWDSVYGREVVLYSLGSTYAACADAQVAGFMVAPVYVITALAYTPQGSRRIGQYEVAAVNITPPPAALALDGPAPIFSPTPSSTVFTVNGNNAVSASNTSAYTGPGTCTSVAPAVVPAVGTGDATSVTTIDNSLIGPPDRTTNYTGTVVSPSTISVVDESSTGTNQLTGLWSSPSLLNSFIAQLANGADQKLSGCGISGTTTVSASACTPPAIGMGTDANPLITYVNGDFNMGSSSGAGVLIVTGTIAFTGAAGFDGLVLVVGQGIMSESGGGNGAFNGSVFLANTYSHTSPYGALSTLGSPQIAWNGGGGNTIRYNSCWADALNNLHYTVVASREEMY